MFELAGETFEARIALFKKNFTFWRLRFLNLFIFLKTGKTYE
jgi:hypothetical protein